MLKYLLDTNIVIYVIKQRPRIALDRFNREHGHMAVSSITLAELIHGAEKSTDPARNLAAIEDFCSRLVVLAYGDKAAWGPRIKTGIDALYASALKGKAAMPAKGGNAALPDADVRAAVDHLVAAGR